MKEDAELDSSRLRLCSWVRLDVSVGDGSVKARMRMSGVSFVREAQCLALTLI